MRLAWLGSLALLGAIASPALARQGAEDSTLEQAKQHFDRGKDLYRNGRYEEAIREFRAADNLRASPILAYNIGLALEKLGRCRAAVNHFERYLREQPDAENRADTERKIAEQRAKISAGSCGGDAAPTPPPPHVGAPPQQTPAIYPPPVGYPEQPEPFVAPPARGTHPFAIGVRFGPVFGGIGTRATQSDGNGLGYTEGYRLESAAGIHVRASVLFPLVSLVDRRTILQGEVFGAFVRYGFNQTTDITPVGDAKLAMGGFGLRGAIYPFPRIPLAIVPSVGAGIGGEFISVDVQGCGSVSTSVAAPIVNVDIALRYELAEHHGLYFSPANLYFVLPSITDGGFVDNAFCYGEPPNTAAKLFGFEDVQANYALDFGYLFQF